MKSNPLLVATIVASLATAASAQDALAPVQAILPGQLAPQTVLPANTEVTLSMNDDLTTKGGKIEEGEMFRLSVVQDVRFGQYIIIPRGTPAFGEVTWKTGKGAFGKSGKMEIELRYIDLNGRRIPISGKYRQEGEGNTVATIGAVIAVGVFAGFVTGRSARIPRGRELTAFTTEALPIALPAGAPAPSEMPIAAAAITPAATSVLPASAARPAATSRTPKGAVTCVTC